MPCIMDFVSCGYFLKRYAPKRGVRDVYDQDICAKKVLGWYRNHDNCSVSLTHGCGVDCIFECLESSSVWVCHTHASSCRGLLLVSCISLECASDPYKINPNAECRGHD